MLIKNLKIRKKSKKFENIKIGLCFIKTKKKSISYKLKIHLVFYILLLKLIDLKILIQNTFYFQTQKEDKFKVKAILN